MIMSETFIRNDSLQHLEISRQIYPTNQRYDIHCFDVMLIFQINTDNTCCSESILMKVSDIIIYIYHL